MKLNNETEYLDDYKVFHITHEISLSLSAEDSLAALKTSQKEHKKFKKLLAATSLGGGKEIRIPLGYGKKRTKPQKSGFIDMEVTA